MGEIFNHPINDINAIAQYLYSVLSDSEKEEIIAVVNGFLLKPPSER